MFTCPKCGKPAKTERGLRKHLSGTYAYGGHNMSDSEISRVISSLLNDTLETPKFLSSPKAPAKSSLRFPSEYSANEASTPESVNFLEQMLETLMYNKSLPKFQFERRIDAVISQFLPQILSQYYGGSVVHVVPEFPIKKDGNNLSRNADYLLFKRGGIPSDESWIMAELKTDDNSISYQQLSLYQTAMKKGMNAMISDIENIRNASAMKSKYDELLKRLDKYPPDRPLKVVYVMIIDNDAEQYRAQYPRIDFLGRGELKLFTPDKFADEWKMFREIVLGI